MGIASGPRALRCRGGRTFALEGDDIVVCLCIRKDEVGGDARRGHRRKSLSECGRRCGLVYREVHIRPGLWISVIVTSIHFVLSLRAIVKRCLVLMGGRGRDWDRNGNKMSVDTSDLSGQATL